MTRPARVSIRTVLLIAIALAGGRFNNARAAEFTLNGRTFTLPDGFTIEVAASPPLVDRPIVADFDEKGRLYAADSSGSNDPVQKQIADKPHRVVRLEDTDGDGKFDRRTVFADKLMFPEGAMWLDGSLYVSAPPSIWKLTDTDDDGVADKRVEWFQGKTLTGCANDLHGPYAGPDGWIYWAKGAFAQQTYERPGKKPFVTSAAHIFRCRPDGSGIEPVMTGGMDNPVDVVFTPGGERIFTTTFLQHPGGGKRDGLIHAIYGGVYGKVHNVLDSHPWTSPNVMPVLAHLGPAAPCGLTRYESDTFGPEYRDNLFACNFNLQRVTRHVLTPRGATFTSADTPFLSSNHHDFHPTDVIEDADGSLLVIDTGGWYKLCCPTSQLHKPDVLGAIYRVRRQATTKVDDPRGLKLDWVNATVPDLARRLDDPRPAVRRRAIEQVGRGKAEAVVALRAIIQDEKATPLTRRNAVWAATRINDPAATSILAEALSGGDETLRQAATHGLSVRRDAASLKVLIDQLSGTSAHNRRAAAEALGRLGNSQAVDALLGAAANVDDRVLEHSLIYALIEIADPKATVRGLDSTNPQTRRAAMIALDQMGGNHLTAARVAPGLASTDPATREAASWIVGRHPEWAGELAGFFRERLKLTETKQSDAEQAELVGQLARFAGEPPIRDLLAEQLSKAGKHETRRIAVRAIARSGLKEVPESWVDGLTEVLTADRSLTDDVVAAVRALPLTRDRAKNLSRQLIQIGDEEALRSQTRLDALAVVPGGLTSVNAGQFVFLVKHLDPENAVGVRSSAANVLSRASLQTEQLSELTESLKSAGPLEIDRLLTAFEQSTDEGVGLKLVAALTQASATGSLRVDTLKPRLDKYGEPVRKQAESLYAKLNVDAADQKARLESLLPTLAGGDVRRGQLVFNGTKAGCLTCHAVGYVGGQVGPDLTRIGEVRTERDMLESILFPSLSFVRSYEPLTVATKAGKVINGLVRKDSADEVVLAVNATEEARIPRDEIEEMRPGSVSVMPAGLDRQLTREELADLLAFLKSRK